MPLVRKVGSPAVAPNPLDIKTKEMLVKAREEIARIDTKNASLKEEIEDIKANPTVVEKVVEVETKVRVQDPILLQAVAELESENADIQRRMRELDTRTTNTLQQFSNERLALQRTLEQTITDLEDKSFTLDLIEKILQGKWPWMRKKTLRRLLKET